jgi:hypothetical protein
MDMMGGVLQIRREDELKKDVPVPAFVLEKPQREEWTLDEQKQYAVYEQKCKELQDERDKLRKQLNAEIIKINEQIAECYANFDQFLLALHLRKCKTQQAIYQEELKIARLVNSVSLESELDAYDAHLAQKLEALKEKKKSLTQEVQQVKKKLELSRETFEIMQAEDKAQEKVFMREFSDVSVTLREALFKLYKKRSLQHAQNVRQTYQSKGAFNTNQPLSQFVKSFNYGGGGGGGGGQSNETSNNNPQVGGGEHHDHLSSDNPYADRPSTALQVHSFEQEVHVALAELDDFEANAPPGVDTFVWDRFVAFRRAKWQAESELRDMSLQLAEQAYYVHKLCEEDETCRRRIDELSKQCLQVQELRLRLHHNLELQLLMKQGQVEIDSQSNVHNFETFVLIHRNVVESLNKVIMDHGKQKISIMGDSMDFRKGIRQLEWEHKKMKMTIEDYIQKQKDITYLKLSREIQEYLNSVDYDGKKQKEIATLEQTVAYQAKQHEKVLAKKERQLNDVRKEATRTANLNAQYDDHLKEANVSLYERKNIAQDMSKFKLDYSNRCTTFLIEYLFYFL